VIYTTPLKALSNQKVGEMRERFGADRVGLQTGDVSLNPEGQVVVMTTEVLRNIMYRVVDAEDGLPPLPSWLLAKGLGCHDHGVIRVWVVVTMG
jgi:hypothetical protein